MNKDNTKNNTKDIIKNDNIKSLICPLCNNKITVTFNADYDIYQCIGCRWRVDL